MPSDPIPFPHEKASPKRDAGLTDHEIGDLLNRGIAAIPDAMDRAQIDRKSVV